MKKLLFLLGLVGSLAALPEAAQASCTLTGQVIRVLHVANTNGPSNKIYFRESEFSTFYYWARTSDDSVVNTAAVAVAAMITPST